MSQGTHDHGAKRRLLQLLTLACPLLACANQAPAGEAGETSGDALACEDDTDCLNGLCASGTCVAWDAPKPYLDAWRDELVLPAEQFRRLIIGGGAVNNNFINRGDIEVRTIAGTTEIRVQIQRFTIARTQADADRTFTRMGSWAYSLELPSAPTEAIAGLACESSNLDFCQVRCYYEGLLQPARDGANFRISLPVGWDGELHLETQDNLADPRYPDRGDVRVDGLAGPLRVVLDSGRAEVRLADDYRHFPGCPLDDPCLVEGLAPDCGCSDYASVDITARANQAAEITVDAPPTNYYKVVLQSADAQLELGCEVELDCEGFGDCQIDPDTLGFPAILRASLNYPGPPAETGSGIAINLQTSACAEVEHADQPSAYFEGPAVELRGSVRLCSGCL